MQKIVTCFLGCLPSLTRFSKQRTVSYIHAWHRVKSMRGVQKQPQKSLDWCLQKLGSSATPSWGSPFLPGHFFQCPPRPVQPAPRLALSDLIPYPFLPQSLCPGHTVLNPQTPGPLLPWPLCAGCFLHLELLPQTELTPNFLQASPYQKAPDYLTSLQTLHTSVFIPLIYLHHLLGA